MTLKERMDVIETVILINKHKAFSKRIGLVDKTLYLKEKRNDEKNSKIIKS